MITLNPKKVESNNLVITVNQVVVARGHKFMAQLRRGGKFNLRKSRRNEKQKFNKNGE